MSSGVFRGCLVGKKIAKKFLHWEVEIVVLGSEIGNLNL